MFLRVHAYTPNGSSLGVLPSPLKVQASMPMNDQGGLTMEYGKAAARPEVLEDPVELAVEVSRDGGPWTEPRNSRYLYLRRGGDDVEKPARVDVEGLGYAWRLTTAKVFPDGGPLDSEGKRKFLSVTPGGIMVPLLEEAQTRGALEGLEYDFTESLDSYGNPWANTLTIYYEPGMDYLVILRNLADQGMVDFWTEGRTLRVFNAESAQSARRLDQAAEPVVLRQGRDLKEAPYKGTWENLSDFVYILGDDGVTLKKSQNVPMPWGRQESFITNGGVSDKGTMNLLADSTLALASQERVERTYGLTLRGVPFLPFLDYFPGDYVGVRTVGKGQAGYRVRQVTVERDEKGAVSGTAVLNDKFLEAEVRQNRRVNGIVNGAQSTGGTGATPTPGPDVTPPGLPQNMNVATDYYLTPQGEERAVARMSWEPVTENFNGSPTDDVDHYEVRWKTASAEPVGEPTTLKGATPHTTLNAQWDRRAQPFGWIGGDGAASVRLANGMDWWVFGDTSVGTLDTSWKINGPWGMVNNALVETDPADRDHFRTLIGQSNLLPEDWAVPSEAMLGRGTIRTTTSLTGEGMDRAFRVTGADPSRGWVHWANEFAYPEGTTQVTFRCQYRTSPGASTIAIGPIHYGDADHLLSASRGVPASDDWVEFVGVFTLPAGATRWSPLIKAGGDDWVELRRLASYPGDQAHQSWSIPAGKNWEAVVRPEASGWKSLDYRNHARGLTAAVKAGAATVAVLGDSISRDPAGYLPALQDLISGEFGGDDTLTAPATAVETIQEALASTAFWADVVALAPDHGLAVFGANDYPVRTAAEFAQDVADLAARWATEVPGKGLTITLWPGSAEHATAAQAADVAADVVNLQDYLPPDNMLTGGATETSTVYYQGINVYDIFKDHVGEPVTVSFDAKADAPTAVNMYGYQSSGISVNGAGGAELTTEWTRHDLTAEVFQYTPVPNPTQPRTDGTIGFTAGTRDDGHAWQMKDVHIQLGTEGSQWHPSAGDLAAPATIADPVASAIFDRLQNPLADYYWLGDAWTSAGKVYVQAQIIGPHWPTPDGWNFTYKGRADLAVFDSTTGDLLEVRPWITSTTSWTNAVHEEGGYVYVFGHLADSSACVLRVLSADPFAGAEAWDGTAWVDDLEAAAPLIPGRTLDSVRLQDGTWHAYWIEAFSTHVSEATAPALTGPWTVQGEPVYRVPEVSGDAYAYIVRQHQQFDTAQGLVFGYSQNTLGDWITNGLEHTGPRFARGAAAESVAPDMSARPWMGLTSWTEPDAAVSPLRPDSAFYAEVRAIDQAGNASADPAGDSAWTPVGPVVVAGDTTVPVQPSTPTASPLFQGMTVYWDGLDSLGGLPAQDWVRVEVHVSPVDSFWPTPATFVGALPETGGTWPVTGLDAETIYFTRLVAVDDKGNRSDPSDQAWTVTAQLVNADLPDDLIEAANVAEGAISTRHLDVAAWSDGLAPNLDFEGDWDGNVPYGWRRGFWTGDGETYPEKVTGPESVTGATSFRLTVNPGQGRLWLGPITPAAERTIYYFAIRVKTSRPITGGLSFGLAYGATPEDVSGWDRLGMVNGPILDDDGSTVFYGRGEVPAGTRFASPVIIAYPEPGQTEPYTITVGEVEWKKIVGSANLAEASIFNLHVNYLDLNQGNVSELNAGKISAGVVDSILTLSGEFRSTDGNFRAGDYGVRTYDPAGNLVTELRSSDGALVSRAIYTATAGSRITLGEYASGQTSAMIAFYDATTVWQFPPAIGYGGGGRTNLPGIGIHAGSVSNSTYDRYGLAMMGVDQKGGVGLITGSLLDGSQATEGANITLDAGGDKGLVRITSGGVGGAQDRAELILSPRRLFDNRTDIPYSKLDLWYGTLNFAPSPFGNYNIRFVDSSEWGFWPRNHMLHTGHSFRFQTTSDPNAFTIATNGDIKPAGAVRGRGFNEAAWLKTQGTDTYYATISYSGGANGTIGIRIHEQDGTQVASGAL